MKITIIGGGNIGTLLAAEWSSKGFDVCVYTSRADKWSKNIEVYNENDKLLFVSDTITATDNLETAVENSEIIVVTYPPKLFKNLSMELEKYIEDTAILGVVPGTGGVEFAFKNLIDNGIAIFGLQRVHSISRLKEYGKSVCMLGRKDHLELATIPKTKGEFVKSFLEDSLDMPCSIVNNYLSITMTPSNPVLHTSRIYALFKDYSEGEDYPKNFLFYGEWDDESSDLLIKCDEEVQKLCSLIDLDLTEVNSLKNHYESHTVKAMTNKISNIPSLHGITSPMIEQDNGNWVPDFTSRYFSSDFPYGLKILIDIAELYDYYPVNLIKIWNWYLDMVNPDDYFDLKKYCSDKNSFEELYKK